MKLADEDFQRLLDFRTELRHFLRWSEKQAHAAGLSPAQHQLLLAIRGHPDPVGPTVNDLAKYLALRQNSTVELINRAAAAGLVQRRPDAKDGRLVRLRLTPVARTRLTRLAAAHLEELVRLGPRIHGLCEGIGRPPHPSESSTHEK